MRTRQAAIYYDYLASRLDELNDCIDEIKGELIECPCTYLQDKLCALLRLSEQLSDLRHED